MAEYALPCLVCGRALVNIESDVDNQPDDGIYLVSEGHYGSRVFDPVDGSFLEFSICDPCLVAAGEAGRVYAARTRRPVLVDGWGRVGWEPADYRPVLWRKGMPGFHDARTLWLEELDTDLASGRLQLSPGLTPEMVRTLLDGMPEAEDAEDAVE